MSRLATSVFVGCLNFRTIESDLQFHFSQCGKVKECQIVRDRNGSSKGFGFVWYHRPQDAEFAVKKLEGSLLDGKNIHVEFNNEALKRKMDAKQQEREAIMALREQAKQSEESVQKNEDKQSASSDTESEEQKESSSDKRRHKHRHHRKRHHRHHHRH